MKQLCRQIRKLTSVTFFLLLCLVSLTAHAQPPLIYTAQAEDTLPKLAEKYYLNPAVWSAIYDATNAGSQPLTSPYLLPPGHRLIIPPPGQVETSQADDTMPVAIPPLSANWLVDFTGYVEEARVHFEIPGAAVAVVRPHQIALGQGFGERAMGSGQPVTPDTLLRHRVNY
jgi:hypothetical protein